MKITLQELLSRIASADSFEVDSIVTALSRRYTALHPDWEITIFTLPKNDLTERRRILVRILEYEQMRQEGQ